MMPQLRPPATALESSGGGAGTDDIGRDDGDVATDLAELVSIDPGVMHGQAVLRGTRIPVAVVLDCLAAGMSEEAIRAQYPTLPEGFDKAAIAYAAALAREEIVPLDPHRA
jgi:uncharacterized protein (DUF433 family)